MQYNYLPLGDSYTIGEGAKPNEAWPNILVNHLKKDGIDIKLIGNPAVTGFTTQQLIDIELPIFNNKKPNFTTLLIGVNDWVQEIDPSIFEKNIIYILNNIQDKLPDKSKIILITIPDFGVTKGGQKYLKGRNSAVGIAQFNSIIKKNAEERNLPCVDIFPISNRMENEPDLVADDNLHGSAKMYTLWEQLIRPVALQLLRGKIQK